MPRVDSPVNGAAINGSHPAPPAPGSMGPPSRPADKGTDIRTLEDPLAGTGVNLDEEERNLTNSAYYSSQPGPQASFGSQGTSFGPSSSGTSFDQPGSGGYLNVHEERPEDFQRRRQAEADFRAGRWAQHPLWDAFLQGDPLEKRLNKCAYENGIKSPKDGLFYATKGQTRPQTTRVTGHDGASQIIDRGQTILSTESGDALGDIMKLVSLATKDRVTGLLDHAARLACERRDHSAGRIPTEWKTVAVAAHASPAASQAAAGVPASPSLKRKHIPTAQFSAYADPVQEHSRKWMKNSLSAQLTALSQSFRKSRMPIALPSRLGWLSVPNVALPNLQKRAVLVVLQHQAMPNLL